MSLRTRRLLFIPLLMLVLAFTASLSLAQDSVKLNFFFLGDELTDPFMQQTISDFQTANPGVTVNLQSYPNEAYKTTMQVAIGSDAPPDLFFNWAGDDTGRLAREGNLLDLTAYSEQFGWKDSINPGALDAFTFGGKVYGAPYSLEAKYYYYNKDIFTQQGLTVPTTFDELLATCTKLKDAGITPMAFGNQERWEGVHYLSIFNQKVVGEQQTLQDYGLDTPADQLFTDPSYATAFQRLVDMQKAGCFGDAVNSTTPDAALALFMAEQSAMYYQGTWIMGNLTSGGMMEKVGMFRMPPMTDAAARGNQDYALMAPIGIEISAKTQHPDEAAKFLEFFLSQDVQRKFVQATNRIPVRADALGDGVGSPELVAVVNDLATTKGAVGWLDTVLENRISEAYLNNIQEVLAGSKTPEQAAAAIRETALTVQADLKATPESTPAG